MTHVPVIKQIIKVVWACSLSLWMAEDKEGGRTRAWLARLKMQAKLTPATDIASRVRSWQARMAQLGRSGGKARRGLHCLYQPHTLLSALHNSKAPPQGRCEEKGRPQEAQEREDNETGRPPPHS
jgi:hypothetical protein